MRQWKIALSLAMVGAVAAPFAFHTNKMHYPQWRTWTPLTVDEKQQLTAYVASCSLLNYPMMALSVTTGKNI
jgi:hypothetical protein